MSALPDTSDVNSHPTQPTLREAVPVWARVAALSFGGPAGQIAVMHRIIVDEKRWISENVQPPCYVPVIWRFSKIVSGAGGRMRRA